MFGDRRWRAPDSRMFRAPFGPRPRDPESGSWRETLNQYAPTAIGQTSEEPLPESTLYQMKDSQKAAFLNNLAPLGVSQAPLGAAGPARFGGMKFDRDVLREVNF